MNSALEIHEILHQIFTHLLRDDRADTNRHDLFSCALTCKAFSEAALDIMWKNLPSIAVMPFGHQHDYILEPDNPRGPMIGYCLYLERLKYYGKRTRALRLHNQLTTTLLKHIMRLRDISEDNQRVIISPDSHLPLISAIFPGLTSLSLFLSVNPLFEDISEPQIRTFLLPTVRTLHLNFAAGGRYENLTDTLRTLNYIKPNLTNLTLDWEIVSRFTETPCPFLDMELTQFINSLLHLEKLSLPFYLLTEPVFAAIAALPELKELTLGQPAYIQFNLSSAPPPTDFSSAILLQDAFASLRTLSINSTFKCIPGVLNAHPLTSNLTHFSASCAPPPPRITLKALFPTDLSTLDNITHLSMNFKSVTLRAARHLDCEFFRPLFENAPFIHKLVSLQIIHGAPLDLHDHDFEEIAKKLPSVEEVRFDVTTYNLPRGVRRFSPKIKASLDSIASFARHCPKLRVILLPVDAETVFTTGVPPLDSKFSGISTHPVYVDMSISPIGPDIKPISQFLDHLFPHPWSEVVSRRTPPRALEGDGGARVVGYEIDDGSKNVDEDMDTYTRRWKFVGQLMASRRGTQRRNRNVKLQM